MAIVVDPDNSDRSQVIFGSENRLISIYPVGSIVDLASSGTVGISTGSENSFSDVTQTWISQGVVAGDILCVFNGQDAGHYVIFDVPEEGRLRVTSASWDGHNTKPVGSQTFTGDTALLYEIRDPATGSLTDGITKQALYSYGKEEWLVDSNVGVLGGYSDDLIRHEFPYEAITSEQFEIGGGASHENWSYFNDFTRKKIRTGGWADLLTAGSTLEEWTGIITLGSLDSDTQVYYQPLSASADPVDFDFLGAVNEPIEVFSGSFDTRSFLKLFARKKSRTYDQSEITDIGVTTIQTIVNRFPLAHASDPAITSLDGVISGTSPFRNPGAALSSDVDGATANVDDATGTFTDGDATFASDGVVIGDTLNITTGNNIGSYTIVGVAETILTVTTAAEPQQTTGTGGPFEAASSLTYTVTSTVIIPQRSDGGIADIDLSTGLFESTTGGLQDVVDAGDILIIRGPSPVSSSFVGVYKIVTGTGDTQLTINTVDQNFSSASNIEFEIRQPGMYLQQKAEDIGAYDAGTLHFTASSPPAILRNTGLWSAEGTTAGTVLDITNTTSNNSCFTVASVTDTTATLVATDTVVAEVDTTASIVGTDYFKRSIQGVTYGFRWRLFGNSTTLLNQYEFVQHQLRQPTDIDFSESISRGDVTDLLMSFATPTATTFNTYIDDIANADLNNVTFRDACGVDRINAFVAAGTISFNNNLQGDGSAVYRMFFTNNDAGDDDDSDYGTPNAIIVLDNASGEITGSVGGASSVAFTYDYDNNVQRGAGSGATDAPITVVAIGLSTAQFVLATATIERSKSNNVSLVSALERNYSNP
jgi:hypothetical protein